MSVALQSPPAASGSRPSEPGRGRDDKNVRYPEITNREQEKQGLFKPSHETQTVTASEMFAWQQSCAACLATVQAGAILKPLIIPSSPEGKQPIFLSPL